MYYNKKVELTDSFGLFLRCEHMLPFLAPLNFEEFVELQDTALAAKIALHKSLTFRPIFRSNDDTHLAAFVENGLRKTRIK